MHIKQIISKLNMIVILVLILLCGLMFIVLICRIKAGNDQIAAYKPQEEIYPIEAVAYIRNDRYPVFDSDFLVHIKMSDGTYQMAENYEVGGGTICATYNGDEYKCIPQKCTFHQIKYDKITLYVADYVSDGEIKSVEEAIKIMPDDVIGSIAKTTNHVKVYVIGDDLMDQEDCKGYLYISTDAKNNRLVLSTRSDNLYQTALHELSHWADYYYSGKSIMAKTGISSGKKFRKIMAREYGASPLADDNYYSDPEEFFAESMARYYWDPSYKKECPATCDYIKELVYHN